MFVFFILGGRTAQNGQELVVNVNHVHAVHQRDNNECLIDMGAEAYLVKGSLDVVFSILNTRKGGDGMTRDYLAENSELSRELLDIRYLVGIAAQFTASPDARDACQRLDALLLRIEAGEVTA